MWGGVNHFPVLSFSVDFAFLSVFCYHHPTPKCQALYSRTMVIVLCCINPISLSSSFKAMKTVFCCPCELLSKMRSFGNGFKPDVMWTKSCVQFSSPLEKHFTVTPYISGKIFQTWPDLRERTFLTILWDFGKRDKKQVIWLVFKYHR